MAEDKKTKKVYMTETNMDQQDLISQILQDLKKSQDDKVVKLGFDSSPTTTNKSSLHKISNTLIPNHILKRIRASEELIGGIIIPTRARQASLFTRPRANRFDIGFTINLQPHIETSDDDETKERIRKEIFPKLREMMLNCGRNDGLVDSEKKNLSQLMMEIVEDGLTFGAFSVEIMKDSDGNFHSFRARDAGTIYFINKTKRESSEADNIRVASEKLLMSLDGESVNINRFDDTEYTYVQVIDGMPSQTFTDEELIYWPLFPSTEIERGGYPVSPIERIVTAVTTHINLTTHNKMFFLNGRAARNILVFKSEDLEESDIQTIRSQMVAHINSANASWRMPVFGVGKDDEIATVPLDGGSKDMEFQYLADLNKRMIFAAFQMSPDEVAALTYLSRGTNSQSLSESNNEYKLIAARDVGLRPLLMSIEDFFNERLLPKINPEWAKLVRIDLEGLDAESPEKEATRLQQDSALYLNMNDIMGRVEKDAVTIGGEFPLNQAYLQLIEKYYTKGQILKAFGGEEFKDADKNPDMQYYMNDPVWLQMQQMKMQQQAQQQQMQMQQQAQEQQMQQQAQQQGQENEQPQDLGTAVDQLSELVGKSELTKSEKNLPVTRKELLKMHRAAKKKVMDDFQKGSKDTLKEILAALEGKHHSHDDEE